MSKAWRSDSRQQEKMASSGVLNCARQKPLPSHSWKTVVLLLDINEKIYLSTQVSTINTPFDDILPVIMASRQFWSDWHQGSVCGSWGLMQGSVSIGEYWKPLFGLVIMNDRIQYIQMSRPTNATNSRHRKDNYSLEIKAPYRSGSVYTPFAKKRMIDEKLFLRLKTQTTHNASMHDKDDGKKRRFSLTKSHKLNHSIDIQATKEKIKRIALLMEDKKFHEALPIIRQFLMREEFQGNRNQLYYLQAACFRGCGKLRQAEQTLTRLLNEQPSSYELLIERGKIRFELGAKQLALRDLRHTIFLKPNNPQGYLELCRIYQQSNDIENSLNIILSGLHNNIQSGELYFTAIQLLLQKKDTSNENILMAKQLLKKSHEAKFISSSELMYMQGLILEFQGKINESCIYYEQCVTNNNSRQAVTKAIQHLTLIKIEQRDYYSAYHTINRTAILCVNRNYIQAYSNFLEGVITIMKKKYEIGFKILDDILVSIEKQSMQVHSFTLNPIAIKCRAVLHPLLLRFIGYALFKLGRHQRCVTYYDKLTKWGLDECSSYNRLLAEGIVQVEKNKDFQTGIEKFEQAKYIYPAKVEPSIYIGMTVIFRDICLNAKVDGKPCQSLTSAVIHAMQEMNDAFDNGNDSSSNLLFHRTILHLYLEEWPEAQADISLCIQKAEDNQPKYFYLRGLTYAVAKQIKKAINEYSISLSLNPEYHLSILQRAKCYFLLGETENGFKDLKLYMIKKPNDFTVHKWIGDLLYEGRSYEDAIKAYMQIQDNLHFEAEIMKCKCLVRLGDLQQVTDILNKVSKSEQCLADRVAVDFMAISLLRSLGKSTQTKDIVGKIKKLNSALEENQVGYIFNLIDCMNLLGVASLYSGKFDEAYQSFLLVLELFQTLKQKNESELKSDCSHENLSLHQQDIIVNTVIAVIGMKNMSEAIRMMREDLLFELISEERTIKLTHIIQALEEQNRSSETFVLESEIKKTDKIKLKPLDLKAKGNRIKCFPSYSLFHVCAPDLYSREVAQRMVEDLKPSYIDNMPEGPWIKRNEHGVVFTDHMIEQDGSSIFLSSMRTNQDKDDEDICRESYNRTPVCSLDTQRQKFKKMMALDQRLEKKLNSLIDKSQNAR